MDNEERQERDAVRMGQALTRLLALRAPSRPKRIAIVTVYDGSKAYQCSMVLWCASALRLKARLAAGAEIVVMSPSNVRSPDCPHARYEWGSGGKATAAAVTSYLRRHSAATGHGSWSYLKRPALLKVAAFSLVQYDLLLYVDMDADLWPEGVGRPTPPPGTAVGSLAYPGKVVRWPGRFSPQKWDLAVAAFMRSSALFVGSPDHASPVNTGVWLMKPRVWLFRAALRTLRTADWNRTTGFDGVSDARTVSEDHALLERLAAGHKHAARLTRGVRRDVVLRRLRKTVFVKERTWLFVGGNIDQGLFFHVVFLLAGVGTWSWDIDPDDWKIEHYWGPGKPWGAGRGPAYARQHYLRRVREEFPALVAKGGNQTRCQSVLGAAWAELVRKRVQDDEDSPGWTPYPSPVLPGDAVADLFVPRLTDAAGVRAFGDPGSEHQ